MQTNKPTLVIDWDETLAFAGQIGPETEDLSSNSELANYMPKPKGTLSVDRNGVPRKMHLYIRPYVKQFLGKVGKRYNLILWSFGVQEYIRQSLKISKLRSFFQGIVVRENMKIPLKDLAAIEQDLTRIAIIDDSSDTFGLLNPYNCIYTPGWTINQVDDMTLQFLPEIIDFHFQHILAHRSAKELLELRIQVLKKLSDESAKSEN